MKKSFVTKLKSIQHTYTCNQWIIILCILNILLRLPFSNLNVSLWDETSYIQGVIAIANNHLNPFIEFWGYKPPVTFMIPALLFHLFSPSRIFVHWQTYIFSSLAIYMTYLLGKKLFSEWVGFSAAILLCFAPLFINQSFLFLDTIPLTAYIVMSIYCYSINAPISYVVTGSLLVLTKEPAIFVPIGIFLFDITKNLNNKRFFTPEIIRRLFILFPLIPFVIWMLINKTLLGWYLWPFNTGIFTIVNPQRTLTPILVLLYLRRAFIEYGLWIIWGIIICGFIVSKKKDIKPEYITHTKIARFFVFLFIFYFIFYVAGSYLHRYLLFLFPLIFLICCDFLERYIPSKKSVAIICILCYFIGSTIYHLGWAPITWDGDNDLSLFRFIALQQKTINFLKANYPNVLLYTNTTLNTAWETPLYGFVNTPGKSVQMNDLSEIIAHYHSLPKNQQHAILVTNPDSDLDTLAAQQFIRIVRIQSPTLSNTYDIMDLYYIP